MISRVSFTDNSITNQTLVIFSTDSSLFSDYTKTATFRLSKELNMGLWVVNLY